MKTLPQPTLLRLCLVIPLLGLAACSSTPQGDLSSYPEPTYSQERLIAEDIAARDVQSNIYDPWEGMNKRIYNFNYWFDNTVFLPVANGYRNYVPGVARKGVNNFFNNIRDMRTAVNSVLQLKPDKFAQATGRVMVNTTVGLLGLIDVATNMDIPRPNEDFGQTLGRWGVGKGPYLVVPFLGPSNLRDGIGLIPDGYLQRQIYSSTIADPYDQAMWVFDAIDTRSQVPFRYYETGTAFEYETVRWLISVKRDLDVAK